MNIYIINKNKFYDNNNQENDEPNVFFLQEVNQLNELDITDEDVIFWHYGGKDSASITPTFIDEQCEKHRELKNKKLVYFSEHNTNINKWDNYVREIYEKRNQNNSLTFEEFEVNEIFNLFKNHVSYYNTYKNFLRKYTFAFLAKKYCIIESDDINDTIKFIEDEHDIKFSHPFEYSKQYIPDFHEKTNDFTSKIKEYSKFIEMDDYPTELESLFREKLKRMHSLSKFEFIAETILFKPSPKFWKKILPTEEKYIFMIAPWQKPENFKGYDSDKHINILLWNPVFNTIRDIENFLRSNNDCGNIKYNFNTTVLKHGLLGGFYDNDYSEYLRNLKTRPDNSIEKTLFTGVIDNLLIQNDEAFSQVAETDFSKMHLLNYVKDIDDPVLFYLGLDIIGQGYDQHTHEYKSRVDVFSKQLNEESIKHYFTQLCNDMRFTIDALYYKNTLHEKQKIVIIDDNISEDNPSINNIPLPNLFNAYTNLGYSKENFKIINPIDSNQEKCLLSDLGGYSTLYDFYFEDLGIYENELSEINNADILLVDLLYKKNINENAHIEEGLRFISGLNRYLRDCKKESIRGNTNCEEEKSSIAPILAISHDDNASIIIDSIKSGAKDYIVKSRIFNMPGIILKAKHTAGESTKTYHRNFKKLYTLKNEVVGLLQKRKIPVLIDAKDVKNQNYENYKKLLKVIPKTDLHVHVGSCMSPEFIVLSSFITLIKNENEVLIKLKAGINYLHELIQGSNSSKLMWNGITCKFKTGKNWIDELGRSFKDEIKKKIKSLYDDIKKGKLNTQDKEKGIKELEKELSVLRSKLFKVFKIPDYLDKNKLLDRVKSISNFSIAFHLIKTEFIHIHLNKFDWVRVYLLVLATKYKVAKIYYGKKDHLDFFRKNKATLNCTIIDKLRDIFYTGNMSVKSFRERGWTILESFDLIKVTLIRKDDKLDFNNCPIHYILATGTRSSNLVEYLKGFDYTGSQHLKHPFLIHMYARQVLSKFIEDGVSYAELRGSPNGYKNLTIGFDFTDVINCYVTAFNQSQEEVFNVFKEINTLDNLKVWNILDSIKNIGKFNKGNWHNKRMPCKVNLLIAGKRHKPISQMILDAAAAASLRKAVNNNSETASDFVNNRLLKSEVAGFDLSGKEDGFPPELFVEEFSRLSKLHIPLTIHAGENASSEFIENAILQLGASRIGHGLSLAQDTQLIDRVIEEKVCIELCPVGNHQTSHFTKKDDGGRVYPLEGYLKSGVLVSINTDNPTVSDTNIVKEYFKASETMSNQLSIWEALRIMRMGYVSAFMSLSDRKYMLELIDQYLYDLFSDKEVIDVLYGLD